jgi:hypothetical protein
MSSVRASNEDLALRMLARNGIAVIWRLNIAAAEAHRTGHPQSAAALLDLADAAEDAWLRAEGEQGFHRCCWTSSSTSPRS